MFKKQTKTDIGERLFKWMVEHPSNADHVAQLIGISRNSVLAIARDKKEPRLKVRMKIEKFLRDVDNNLSAG